MQFTDAEKSQFGGRDPEIVLQALDEMIRRMIAEPDKFRSSTAGEACFGGIPFTLIIQKRAKLMEFIRNKKK